ncbi:hypothetical protein TNCV_2483241 [Trichonephila clavipes]|uniref:Uncharacterized protein n=1 Tax=Trichonephila clavipes TaxID=2585209 RepID=A0A8X7BAY2_TRICX|nr:hypothetical protein TNCV_2483241 [Trichonephila clavipes]
MNYNRERRDWDVRRMSTDERRNRTWRDAEVVWIDQTIGRTIIEIPTEMNLRGIMDLRTGIGLTGIIVEGLVVNVIVSLCFNGYGGRQDRVWVTRIGSD